MSNFIGCVFNVGVAPVVFRRAFTEVNMLQTYVDMLSFSFGCGGIFKPICA